jgi:hypothetical protein
MKKIFWAITLVAAVVCFVGCEKTTIDSETHTQKFTIGAASYNINNALTIENIKDSVGQVYNAILLSQTESVGNYGSQTKCVIIVFRGNFTPGTYHLAFDPEHPSDHFPMYLVAENGVDNILNFSLSNLLNQADVYAADNGSFTLTMDQNKFTVTTTDVSVKNVKNPAQVTTSSVDFEDNMLRYILSTVVEGNFNGTNIVTAGRTVLNILSSSTNVVAFITENGDLVGFISSTSFDNGIPEGTYSYNDNSIIYLQDMSLSTLKFASSGEISVARNGDLYTINMTGLSFSNIDGTPTMHYVGTMPKFDFPLPQE